MLHSPLAPKLLLGLETLNPLRRNEPRANRTMGRPVVREHPLARTLDRLAANAMMDFQFPYA
jgi:hypothetical protein